MRYIFRSESPLSDVFPVCPSHLHVVAPVKPSSAVGHDMKGTVAEGKLE